MLSTEKLGLEKDFSKLRKVCCEIWSEKEPSNGFRGCCEPTIKCKQMVVSDDDGEMIVCARFLTTNKKIVGDCARQCACLCVFPVQKSLQIVVISNLTNNIFML